MNTAGMAGTGKKKECWGVVDGVPEAGRDRVGGWEGEKSGESGEGQEMMKMRVGEVVMLLEVGECGRVELGVDE